MGFYVDEGETRILSPGAKEEKENLLNRSGWENDSPRIQAFHMRRTGSTFQR